ncbi:6-phosphogluconolactonase [Pseudohongiella acticola]|jgi:6-phosphogluconolactonase|uniref:6-phosphogluconolactonase n=1 Tax=Pseudohongiella acticola TaxID=1524254 RepID=UPI0030EE10C6
MWELHEYKNQSALLNNLTVRISDLLCKQIQQGGKASIALSGGSTPKTLYQQLSGQSLPWQSVMVSLVDERWVAEVNASSNARFIKNTLIQNQAARATFIGMKTSHRDAFAAAESLSNILERHTLPLDLVLLGMGLDGHTASLFPDAKGLTEALSDTCRPVCCAIQPQPSADDANPTARMTLSLNTILSASVRILYISGAAKRDVLEQAFIPGSVTDMPVRAVLHDSQTMTEIYYAPDD